MLRGETARKLYAGYAERQPIIDYHCHLSPAQIAEDHRFSGITELMLGGDHYKWRLMRSDGVEEYYITGGASDYEKFEKFAAVLPRAIGNPIYHWTHLELKRYFGIDECLCPETCREIYEACNEKLGMPEFSARGLIERSNVKVICTTDDPADSLEFHEKIRSDGFGVKVLPAFRPDKAIGIEKADFADYVTKNLGAKDFDGYIDALFGRLEFFAAKGCVVSDHGFDRLPDGDGDPRAAFEKRMSGAPVSTAEENIFKTYMMVELGKKYAEYGFVMQLHFGAMRNNSTRMFEKLGPDTGFDSMSDGEVARPLSRLLDRLDGLGKLPKTILYSLNPKDNYTLGSMLGNFQESGARGKIQLGSAWWFCDQRDGMRAQLGTLANLGVLGNFVGMLTDSRSFVSYTRHEYFRRILCDLIGEWVDDGEYPPDEKALGEIISGICYSNAKEYFGF